MLSSSLKLFSYAIMSLLMASFSFNKIFDHQNRLNDNKGCLDICNQIVPCWKKMIWYLNNFFNEHCAAVKQACYKNHYSTDPLVITTTENGYKAFESFKDDKDGIMLLQVETNEAYDLGILNLNGGEIVRKQNAILNIVIGNIYI